MVAATVVLMLGTYGLAPTADALDPGGDSAFGAAGEVTLALDPYLGTNANASVTGATVDHDGRLLVSVTVDDFTPQPLGSPRPVVTSTGLVARFLPDGSLDTAFGSGGVASVPYASSAVELESRKILVLAKPPLPGTTQLPASLLSADGSTIPGSFAGTGYVPTAEVQADGALVGFGVAVLPLPPRPPVPGQPPSPTPPGIVTNVVERIDSATGNVATTVSIPAASTKVRVLRQRNGRYLFVPNTGPMCTVIGLTAGGAVDPGFTAIHPMAPNPVVPGTDGLMNTCTMTLLPDDSVVVAGAMVTGSYRTLHFGANGEPLGFGTAPYVNSPPGVLLQDVATSGGGRIVGVGSYQGNAFAQSFFVDGFLDQRLGSTANAQIDLGGDDAYQRVVTSPLGGQFAVGVSKQSAAGHPTRTLMVTKLFSWVGTAPDLGIVTTSRFVPIDPVRALDTRVGPAHRKPAAGERLEVSLLGIGGLPADATAAVLNVTATNATGAGYVTVWPSDAVQPTVSNLNVERAGQTVANHVTVALSAGGRAAVYTQSGADIVVDLAGYYVPANTSRGGRFVPAPEPYRLLDTRLGRGAPPAKPGRDGSLDVAVLGVGPVPSTGVAAVVLNVTATEATGAGFVTAWPSGTSTPTVSNLNLEQAGQTRANLVSVRVGAGGRVSLFTQAGTHLLADVAGWYTDDTAPDVDTGLFVPVVPVRVLDTRVHPGGLSPKASIDLRVAGTVAVPPVNASAVAINLTATDTTAAGFISSWPAGLGRPDASNLNAERAGQTLPNAAIVRMNPAAISLYTQGGGQLIVDVNGWFVAPPS